MNILMSGKYGNTSCKLPALSNICYLWESCIEISSQQIFLLMVRVIWNWGIWALGEILRVRQWRPFLGWGLHYICHQKSFKVAATIFNVTYGPSAASGTNFVISKTHLKMKPKKCHFMICFKKSLKLIIHHLVVLGILGNCFTLLIRCS